MHERPLTIYDFARLFAPLRLVRARVGLAVSGGPDSMALAWGAAQVWGAAGLCAFIVDHDLRPESAEEAGLTKARLEALGIEAVVLRWDHGAVKSRVHVAARAARYDLLLAACKARGLGALLLAHHRDDQAETILMRLAKGSGLEGLSGIAAETARDGVRLLRPLLAVTKEQLLATCQANGISFAVDPTNESAKYARGRLRRVKELLAAEGFSADRLLDLGARAGEAAGAVSHYAKTLLKEKATQTRAGAVVVDRAALCSAPQAVGLKALSLALMSVHRTDFAPQREKMLALWRWIGVADRDFCSGENEGDSEGADRRTLHGCEIRKGPHAIEIAREPGAACVSLSLLPGQNAIWDGRWHIFPAMLPAEESGLEIRPLGLQPHALLDDLAPGLRRAVPKGRHRAALPGVWRGCDLVLIPCFFNEKTAPVTACLLPPLWADLDSAGIPAGS